MTDHDEFDFDDPSHDEIRALLGDLKVTGPVPDHVLARLDMTLGDLTADRRDQPEPELATVLPLTRAARRTRLLLVAAAAVLVVGGGVTVNQVIGNTSNNSGTTTAADLPVAPTTTPETAPLPTATPSKAVGSTADSPNLPSSGSTRHPGRGLSSGGAAVAGGILNFSTATFDQDAAQFLNPDLATETASAKSGAEVTDADRNTDLSPQQPPPTTAPDPSATATPGTTDPGTGGTGSGTTTGSDVPSSGGALPKSCNGPADPQGDAYRIKLDGRPAVLVVHPPSDGVQVVTAWSCDGTTVLATSNVPVR